MLQKGWYYSNETYDICNRNNYCLKISWMYIFTKHQKGKQIDKPDEMFRSQTSSVISAIEISLSGQDGQLWKNMYRLCVRIKKYCHILSSYIATTNNSYYQFHVISQAIILYSKERFINHEPLYFIPSCFT